jgi:hypothetical protein
MVLLAALGTAGLPGTAAADDTIKRPGDHPKYAVEIEPHGLLGWDEYYGGNAGFGLGVRFSIPVTDNGFIPTINNSVAVTFGADWLHYAGACYFLGGACYGDANYIFFPIALQWNFFVAHQWSVFGEPGLAVYHAFFPSGYCVNVPGGFHCATETSVWPVFEAGGRYHINENVALVMRIGYPTISFGVSFM